VNPDEAELTVRLASTAARRESARPRLAELLRRVDSDAYAKRLEERGLLPLLGSRALELAPEAADDVLRARVDVAVREARWRALALEMTLRRIVGALAEAGVPALPLKGTTLADRVHGDTGLRPTTDVDVLVHRAQVTTAVDALIALGYPRPSDPVWTRGLPELHYTFLGGEPPVRAELHWRVHWSDRSFSDELIRSATRAPDGLLRAEPAHELALLLLIFARDALLGPRLAADVAAWWDRLGDRLAPGALDGIVARHPSLRRWFVAAVACLEPLLGVAARDVLTDARTDRSTRWAAALADPLLLDEGADVEATIMLIDALLPSGRDKLDWVRRYAVQPLPFVRVAYGLGDAPVAVVAARNALHAAGTVVRKLPRMTRAARRSRARSGARSTG
jgi:hypothetical protein